jgi:phosphomannomutase
VKTIYLFDIDGTLTPPRQPIDDEFAGIFLDWMEKDSNEVYLVTGSDIKKIRHQIFEELLNRCAGVFCCVGNQLYKKGKLIYENKFNIPRGLIEDLEIYLTETTYPVRTGNHIEKRPGMINFSVVGRNANLLQRERYSTWDMRTREREDIVDYVTNNYPTLAVAIGGVISVDIYPVGKDKAQVIEYLKNQYSEELSFRFVGDTNIPGGNDYPLAVVLESCPRSEWFQVESYEETRALIEHSELFN